MESFRTRLHPPYYDYIPKHGLKNLAKYKYSSIDLSLIAKYLLHPFWSWLANYLPEWPAPNLITFAGFVPCMLSFCLTAYLCPTLSEPVPQWVCALNFICLFVYQTLDALDGKQARRTGTSSPLGELFDHGCDALTTIFVALSVSCTIRLGSEPILFLAVISMLVPFYTTQWEEYFTGTLLLGYIGVTEAQMSTLAIYLAGGIFGTDIFVQNFTVFGYTTNASILLVCTLTLSGSGHVCYNALTVYKQWKSGKATAFNAIGYTIPVLCVVISSTIWLQHEPAVIGKYAHYWLLMLGFVIANFVSRIIVYRVCGLDAAFFPELLIPLFIGTANGFLGNALFSTEVGVFFTLAFYVAAYLHFAISIINQMTTYLNIRCFVIPVPNLASNPPVKPAGGVPTPVPEPTSKEEEKIDAKSTNGSAKLDNAKSKSRSPKLSPKGVHKRGTPQGKTN